MVIRLAVPFVLVVCSTPVFAVDQIFADGFDGPKWFIDSDADNYGSASAFVHSATQPPGYVANSLDCDDSNAAIHPGAVDDPDPAFGDTNCDGIDGDIGKAIFVATSGTDSGTCGTQLAPCASPQFAISRLGGAVNSIYVQVGAYSGALTIVSDAAFFGGYDLNWQRGPVTPGGPNSQIQGVQSPMGALGEQAFAVFVAFGTQAVFNGMEIDAPLASGVINRVGRSSYGIYADTGVTLSVDYSAIVQSDGAAGAAGNDGTSATQIAVQAGGSGSAGVQVNIFCDTMTHTSGGAPSTNFCSSGRSVAAGAGGDGGVMDNNCTSFIALPGAVGIDATTVVGTAGKGGTPGSGGGSCGATGAGQPGSLSNGSGGLAGLGAMVSGGIFLGNAGGSGTLGANGGGGGGGGGAGGCDNGTDSYGASGGGGGAGGCAATVAGTGGAGGGGSFGIFALNAHVDSNNTTFVLGHGGKGGDGGKAGLGQPGGSGGTGGPNAPNG